MIFRFLVVTLLVISGCAVLNGNRHHWSVEIFSKRIKDSFHSRYAYEPGEKSILRYNVCEEKIENQIILYPCSLEYKTFKEYLETLQIKASGVGELNVLFFYYAAEMYYFPKDSGSSSVKPIYSFASERGPIYIDDSGAKFALCQSTDGIKCDYLFAEISVKKDCDSCITIYHELYVNLFLKEEMNAENLLNVLKEESVADENYIPSDVVRHTWPYCKMDGNKMADY